MQLILTLYSMEPPFYDDLNKACRTLDPAKLETLGPFARAIFVVLGNGSISDRKRDDALEFGNKFKDTDPLGEWCRSFLLFRGALMKNEWIEDWRKKEYLMIPGCTSTSRNMDVALGFS